MLSDASFSGAKRKRASSSSPSSSASASIPRSIDPVSFLRARGDAVAKLESLLSTLQSGAPVSIAASSSTSSDALRMAAVAAIEQPANHALSGAPNPELSSQLPRHLRRRTASHQRYRMPSQLRLQPLKRTEDIPDRERPRQYRRKPSLLRERWLELTRAALSVAEWGPTVFQTASPPPSKSSSSPSSSSSSYFTATSSFSSSSSSSTPSIAVQGGSLSESTPAPLLRLAASHSWHAKRFFMSSKASVGRRAAAPLWNHILPLHRNDCGPERCLAWAAAAVAAAGASFAGASGPLLIHDASYLVCVSLRGTRIDIGKMLELCCDPSLLPSRTLEEDGSGHATSSAVAARTAAATTTTTLSTSKPMEENAPPSSAAKRARIRRSAAKLRWKESSSSGGGGGGQGEVEKGELNHFLSPTLPSRFPQVASMETLHEGGGGPFHASVVEGKSEGRWLFYSAGAFPEGAVGPVSTHCRMSDPGSSSSPSISSSSSSTASAPPSSSRADLWVHISILQAVITELQSAATMIGASSTVSIGIEKGGASSSSLNPTAEPRKLRFSLFGSPEATLLSLTKSFPSLDIETALDSIRGRGDIGAIRYCREKIPESVKVPKKSGKGELGCATGIITSSKTAKKGSHVAPHLEYSRMDVVGASNLSSSSLLSSSSSAAVGVLSTAPAGQKEAVTPFSLSDFIPLKNKSSSAMKVETTIKGYGNVDRSARALATSNLPKESGLCLVIERSMRIDLILSGEEFAREAWHKLVTTGRARALGINEWRALTTCSSLLTPASFGAASQPAVNCLDSDLSFPEDFPDTRAGQEWRAHSERESFEAYMRRPRSKRPDHVIARCIAPFGARWEKLWKRGEFDGSVGDGGNDKSIAIQGAGHDEDLSASSNKVELVPAALKKSTNVLQPILVMRNTQYLRDIFSPKQAAEKGTEDEEQDMEKRSAMQTELSSSSSSSSIIASPPAAEEEEEEEDLLFPSPTLIPVRIRLLQRGTLEAGDSIHLPSYGDLRSWIEAIQAPHVTRNPSESPALASYIAAVSEPRTPAFIAWDISSAKIHPASSGEAAAEASAAPSSSCSSSSSSSLKASSAPPGATTISRSGEECLESVRPPLTSITASHPSSEGQDGHITLEMFKDNLLDPCLALHPPTRHLAGFISSAVNTQKIKGIVSHSLGVGMARVETFVKAVSLSASIMDTLERDKAFRESLPRSSLAKALVLIRTPLSPIYRPAIAYVAL